MTRRPLISASLTDIRDDTIVLTGSLSLIATALFGGTDRLMRFLQSKIPAAATAADNRYRQWVFALSKTEPMRTAIRVAEECAGNCEAPSSIVFPRRVPSWRSHWRGDRAYLMPLSLLPPLLAALGERNHFTIVKDPSLRFDARIPWEITIENTESLRAVWCNAHAQATRSIELRREGEIWRLIRDENVNRNSGERSETELQNWLNFFLSGQNREHDLKRC